MLSIIISLAVAALIGAVTTRDLGTTWGVVCALAAFLISQVVIMLILRKRLNAVQLKVQEDMMAAQAKLNRQIQLFQQRPSGDMRMMQKKLEAVQDEALRATLERTSEFNRFYKWNIMLPRQINSMKMQLYFQLKEYDKVDELLPKSMLIDARSLCIKLVRMFKNDDPKLDRFYQKKSRRLKGDDLALFANLYAWIKVKKDEVPQAVAALVAARKNTDNPVLIANYENLVNNKVKHFSNSALGDAWYSLYLEEPKVRPQKGQQRMF